MNEGIVISGSLAVTCEDCGKLRNGLITHDLWMLTILKENNRNKFIYLCPDCWQERYKDETEEEYIKRSIDRE